MSDLEMLFNLADSDYAVMVVKHEHEPVAHYKMDGAAQTRYFRKNWSSLILWHNEHPAHGRLTPWHVNNFPGSWLHAFSWLDDSEIGELPVTWNWLSGVSEPFTGNQIPAAIHYTLGVPTTPGCEATPLADLWFKERDSRRAPGRPLPLERLRATGE